MEHFMRNSCNDVLDALYKCKGQKKYAIRGFSNKIKGYGLKPSEFENFEDCSRGIFYKCRKYLFDSHFIEVVDTNKTKSTTHKPRYGITLLGVIKLFYVKEIGYEKFKDMMNILSESYVFDHDDDCLSVWSHHTKKRITNSGINPFLKMFEGISTKILTESLKKVIMGIDMSYKHDHLVIQLADELSKSSGMVFWNLGVKGTEITCNWSPPSSIVKIQNSHNLAQTSEKKISTYTFQDLYFIITDFILKHMWLKLYKEHQKSLPKYLFTPITRQDIADGKRPIDYLVDLVADDVRVFERLYQNFSFGR